MQFTYDITIPANTLETAPTRENTKLAQGALSKIQIDFPWGCAGYVGIRIIHYEHQLYPTNPDKWFVGNDISIIIECDYPIAQGWNEFKIEGYNADDTYEHTPIVNFNILPSDAAPFDLVTWLEG